MKSGFFCHIDGCGHWVEFSKGTYANWFDTGYMECNVCKTGYLVEGGDEKLVQEPKITGGFT